MEHSVGSKGMSTITRCSAAAGVAQTAEDARDLKTTYTQRELRKADETNLLDEQEFCKSSNSIGEVMSQLIGGKRPKNPPKKEKKKRIKKSLTTSTIPLVGSQQRPENHNATSASELNSNGILTVDDNAGSSPGFTEHSTTGPTPAQKKRRKIIAKKGPKARPDHSETTSSVNKRSKNTSKRTQQELKCKKYPSGLLKVKIEKTSDDIIASQMPSRVQNCSVPSKDLIDVSAPKLDVRLPVAPMATKVYYSQRNQRFRSAITHLYYESLNKEPSASTIKPQVSLHSSATSSCSLVPKNVYQEHIHDQQEKTEKPDEILGESSEVSGPHKPSVDK